MAVLSTFYMLALGLWNAFILVFFIHFESFVTNTGPSFACGIWLTLLAFARVLWHTFAVLHLIPVNAFTLVIRRIAPCIRLALDVMAGNFEAFPVLLLISPVTFTVFADCMGRATSWDSGDKSRNIAELGNGVFQPARMDFLRTFVLRTGPGP